MNGELLSVLDHIERDRGIAKEILIAAVESALVSAARRALGLKTAETISVKLNPQSGDIAVYSEGKEVPSKDFGRIAAQTAKQVIIQKIREAERDVIYDDYSARLGNIISGGVHRFEKGNIIVDLGRTEGVLPKKEQISKESYKQGERVRAYMLDVKKTGRGPQIILSRTHPNLIKKMFELEVPEIIDGIVEIKSIAREPGERTKIAVWSKDEKIDCIGACVGMRGSRVKDIVRELRGEKIDIVKWSENPSEYIAAALSPAQILQINIDKQTKKVEVIVEEDQLSLAIGKRGQNVRLAVKLTGWDIDIKPKQAEGKEADSEKRKEEAAEALFETPSIEHIPRMGPKTHQALLDAGFGTLEKLAGAKEEELTGIKGIGIKSARNLIKAAKKLIKS